MSGLGACETILNARDLITLVPTLCKNLITGDITLAVTLVIFASGTKKDDPSDRLKKALRTVGLKVGLDSDNVQFIDTSHKGWNQKMNLQNNVRCIASLGQGQVCQLDNWSYFTLQNLFINY